MNPYIKNLRDFLSQQTPNYKYNDAQSLLEMLHYYYTCDNPIDSGVIRCQLNRLEFVYDRLTFQESTDLFNTVADLCSEHEKKAFLEGIQVGARLYTELAEPILKP